MKQLARIATAACAASFLAACTFTPEGPYSGPSSPEVTEQVRAEWLGQIAPPAGYRQAFRATARGYQEFRCSEDSLGLYWKFVRPHALLRDSRDELLARQNADLSFTHKDGSTMKASIARAAPPNGYSLRWVLMRTSGGTGALSGIAYVQRIATSGGIPRATCSRSQKDELMRVPFTAEFVFWKR